MYNLTLHIEYLLLRHDCVVLPGIGAFINVRHAARLDSDTGTWYPMTREVRFNSALNHDDGLLANSYARKLQTSYNEGRDLLRRDLLRLQEMLASDGEVTMGQLGILHYDNGLISFQPRLTATQMATASGHLPAIMHAPERVEIKKAVTEDAETPASTNADDTIQSVSSGKERVFDTTRNYYIAVNKVFARIAACFMVVATVVLSIIIPTTDNSRMDQASVMPVEKIIRESISKAERPVIEKIPQVEKEVKAEIQSGSYHAIVATFRTMEEAEKFMQQNKVSGYELQYVPTATRVRISAISSDNKEELQQIMSTEDFRSRFTNAWIWRDENHDIK